MELYQKGVALSAQCSQQLEQARLKIQEHPEKEEQA